jgi:iron complex outermembrane receptor protein
MFTMRGLISFTHQDPMTLRTRLAAAIAVVLATSPLFAQNAPATNDDAVRLDTVEVESDLKPNAYGAKSTRALGFALTPQQLPATVNILSSDFLADTRATRLDDVVSFIPGVSLNDNGGWTDDSPLIRGFSGTTVFVNGLRFGGSQLLPDTIERIEVTKGPSGIESGVAEPGGSINIITKQPERERAAELYGALGDFGYRKIGSDVTGALNAAGTVQGRLIAAYEEGAEWRDGRPDETPRWTIAPSINWDYADDSRVLLEFERYYRDDPQDRGIIYLDGAWPGGFAPREWSYHQSTGSNAHEVDRIDLTVDHRFSDALSATLRYQRLDYGYRVQEFRNAESEPSAGDDDLYNPDGLSWNGNTIIPIFWDDWAEDSEQDTIAVDVRAAFAQGSARHEVVGTLSRYRKDGLFTGLYFPNDNAFDIFNPVNHQRPVLTGPADVYVASLEESIDSISLRWLGEWTPAFRSIFGLRRDDARFLAFGSESSAETTSYRVAASYDLSPAHTAFIGYADAYVPQVGVARSGEPVDPTRARALEVGLKSSVFSGGALWSNTVFRIRRDDLAASDPTNEDFESFVVPFGAAQVQGIESELSGRIGEHLDLQGGVALLDAEILDNPDGYAGNRFANTARAQLSAFAGYRWSAFGLSALRTTLGVIHIGEREANSGNNLQLPAYTLVNLGAEVDVTAKLALSFGVNNLFDETYYPAMQDSGARADQVMIGERRLMQVGFRYRF